MTTCPRCGEALPPEGAVCGACGSPITAHREPLSPTASSPAGSPFPPPALAPAAVLTAPTPAAAPARPPASAGQAASEPASEPMLDPPRSHRNSTIAVVALLAAACVVAAVLVFSGGSSRPAAPVDTLAPIETTTAPDPAAEAAQAAAEAQAAQAQAAADAAAAAQLAAQVAADQASADSLVNTFVVQLGAGSGATVGPAEILAAFQPLQAQWGAILVDAGRYQFEHDGAPMPGWYLAIVPQPFPSQEAAAQWCVDQALAADACYARPFPAPAG